jgi:hypothetical protein
MRTVEKMTMWQRIKKTAPFWLTVLFVTGFLNGIYQWGYYRGRAAGALDMKCAIFGVVDRLNDTAPDAEKYALTKLGCRAALAKAHHPEEVLK